MHMGGVTPFRHISITHGVQKSSITGNAVSILLYAAYIRCEQACVGAT